MDLGGQVGRGGAGETIQAERIGILKRPQKHDARRREYKYMRSWERRLPSGSSRVQATQTDVSRAQHASCKSGAACL